MNKINYIIVLDITSYNTSSITAGGCKDIMIDLLTCRYVTYSIQANSRYIYMYLLLIIFIIILKIAHW